MTTDHQIRRLIEAMNRGKGIEKAALAGGMDVKTARKYLPSGKLPSEMKQAHAWRTRKDPFEGTWEDLLPYLQENPRLEAKTLFEHLQEVYPNKYQNGQLRTLQRRIKVWRATEGPSKEIYFPQKHHPGMLGESDFTYMNSLKITIKNELFDHMFYHFVLTYSNWETGNICFSESYESLSEGMQLAFWKIGGAPAQHRTDRLSAAVNKDCNREEFTVRYNALLRHYDVAGISNNPNSGNENGDVEQSHDGFKNAMDQALMMRGSRNFDSRQEYELFAANLMAKRNSGREQKFKEEVSLLKKLPLCKLGDKKIIILKVGKSSTINVFRNTYSVNSRLIGERIEIRASSEYLEVWYGQKLIETLPRLRGEAKSAINYRHIVDWLIRKPGAFENYKHRDDLFPSTTFRIAYDLLKDKYPDSGNKKYIAILNLAAKETEGKVEEALKSILERNIEPNHENVEKNIFSTNKKAVRIDPEVSEVKLAVYDCMLSCGGV
jgi:transposase